MTLSHLIFRSMKKNVKHYYLYFFSLIFSVTLCFSFTTLQSNPTVVEALNESGTATAGFKSATYVLYFIVTFFILYANHLFMKRRSKEIGIYQLVGMTKGLIVRIIAIENIILFVLAVGLGMVTGFLSSRLFAMALMRLLEMDRLINLTFSQEAFQQSILIFSIILIVILTQMVWVIYRVSLLSLFTASKRADERVKRFSLFHMVMGVLGIGLVIYGYYESSILFSVESQSQMSNLFLNMLIILGSTIIGTFLFFRFSVALIMNTRRISKNGHLNISDVLAVTPIMHRMKGNAKSLTLITVLTGLAVGISSLSYIAYYDSETKAKQVSPYDYILLNDQGIEFIDQLQQEGIEFEKDSYRISEVQLNIKDLADESLEDSPLFGEAVTSPVIPLSSFKQIEPSVDLKDGEAFLTGYASLLSEVLPLQKEKDIIVTSEDNQIPLFITDIRKEFVLSMNVNFASPVLVVTDELFKQLSIKGNKEIQFSSQIGINLKDSNDLQRAEEIYQQLAPKSTVYGQTQENGQQDSWLPSYEELRKEQIAMIGTTVFVTAFLGLAFLLTTGSILYFKQMAEAEEEKEAYTTLRKIGFSTKDLYKGIYMKQAFNFGVPLIIGLLHSYFAVKSGWFLFGSELVTPLVITMSLYVVMYTIFAVLSTQYYKKIIRESL